MPAVGGRSESARVSGSVEVMTPLPVVFRVTNTTIGSVSSTDHHVLDVDDDVVTVGGEDLQRS